jgi:hypothetical protein
VGDIALLKIETKNEEAPALMIAPESEVTVGEQVVSVGYPASVDYVTDPTFDPSFKDGSVSSIKTISKGLLTVYELSTAMSGGMSGGPTVDTAGQVVGVNSFGPAGEPQAFNFVRPSSIVSEVLGDKDVGNKLGGVNTLYRAGLTAYFRGDRKEALAKFDEVLRDLPSHSLALEYRRKASALPEEGGGGFPWWGYVLIALGALVLVGGALYALIRSGRFTSKRPAEAEAGPAAAPGRGRTVLSPRPGEPTLVVKDGPGAGQRFPIKADTMLGREEADISLDDAEVSRRHAMIRRVNGKLELSDLRSANGTRINGSRVEGTRFLSDGDTIEVGHTTLGVEMPPGAKPGKTATGRRPEER